MNFVMGAASTSRHVLRNASLASSCPQENDQFELEKSAPSPEEIPRSPERVKLVRTISGIE
jgi:hypothetical protein